ncbi:DUF4959 domain-containing protein [Prevotella sp. KH2C16]|uniref:DUF4959 domain-containing protein n=1 Tax=Prevotella sp. KH2C16 TaxID=1855325 RepID=UPI0008F280F2|nr:DUF4959 domain-containing protein [Prevotella sp. KH2C16]SFG39873.1 protein of unknown function [Prevotella sp. KH2C16]
MKKILLFSCALVVSLLLFSCGDGDRVDQIDGSIPVPQGIKVTKVSSIPGGAVIKVEIPNDVNLKGVVAKYNRNGTDVETRISRYIDTLVVEGYADTLEHTVQVSSFNVNMAESAPVSVQITPLAPAIQTVDWDMQETFGGLKIHIMDNVDRADLAVVLLSDADTTDINKPDESRKWVEVTTLFTSAKDIFLARRNLPAETTLFGVYLRDHWGNLSPVKTKILTPWEESELVKGKFRYFNPGDDNSFQTSGSYPVTALWDNGVSNNNIYASANGPMPQWLTINLGQTARLSRIAYRPRYRYLVWSSANVRQLEFWGSYEVPTGVKNPNNEHGFEDCWFKLGWFEQPKPSGYNPDGTVGEVTQEDYDYYNDNTEYEMDNTGEYPHANDKLRYLRIVFMNTFTTWETKATVGSVQVGEITPYGQILE